MRVVLRGALCQARGAWCVVLRVFRMWWYYRVGAGGGPESWADRKADSGVVGGLVRRTREATHMSSPFPRVAFTSGA